MCTSLLVQLDEDVSQSCGVIDPFHDAALLVEGDDSVGTDVQLPTPGLGVFTEALEARTPTSSSVLGYRPNKHTQAVQSLVIV